MGVGQQTADAFREAGRGKRRGQGDDEHEEDGDDHTWLLLAAFCKAAPGV
jgi:hypothetical protein